MMSPEFPPTTGGIATRSYVSAQNLTRLDARVIVLTMAPKANFNPVTHHSLEVKNISWLIKIASRGTIGFFMKIAVFFFYGINIAIARKIDLIYSTLVDVGISSMFISKLLGVPFFVAIHGMEIAAPKGIGKWWLQLVLKHASALTILADRQRTSLMKLGVPDDKIHLIPEGLDLNKFGLGDKDPGIVKQLALDGKKVVLTVGRLVKRKGHDMVIKSLPGVLEKVPETVYLIVGTGPEEQALRELSGELGLTKSVLFAGFIADDDLPKVYSASDVFIMPSREINGDIEGFGIVYLEASACGKPVIGGRSGGVGDAVADGISGVLVNPLDIGEISQALITLLTEQELAMRLGSQGRKRVEEEFSYEASMGKLSELLGTIKSKKAKKRKGQSSK